MGLFAWCGVGGIHPPDSGLFQTEVKASLHCMEWSDSLIRQDEWPYWMFNPFSAMIAKWYTIYNDFYTFDIDSFFLNFDMMGVVQWADGNHGIKCFQFSWYVGCAAHISNIHPCIRRRAGAQELVTHINI